MSYLRHDLGDRIKSFTPVATERVTDASAATADIITDLKPVASYSWIPSTTGSTVPVIAVPGSPGVWRSNPVRVPADTGVNMVDQNTHNVGQNLSHLAPIFAAVDAMPGSKPSEYDFKSLDIITDRNGLRKLLRWANRLAEKDFRIDLDVAASKTVLFTRRDERTSEQIEGFRGFGQEYLKAAARLPQGLEKATGHHRIIELKMGGLKVLIRFTADACEDMTSADDLASIVASIDLQRTKGHSATKSSTAPKPSSMKGIHLSPLGPTSPVSHSSLIEVKTRAVSRPLDWDEAYPQLYLSQTPFLYLAQHTKGTFGPPEKYALRGRSMEVHARKAQKGIARMVEVLKEVVDAVRKDDGEGKEFSLVCVGGKMELFRRTEGSGGVGDEILGRFKARAG